MGRTWDVVIIGGGAAGLMCAAVAGIRRRRVLLLEHNATVGEKIRISGGGRCNFTNLGTSPENFLSANRHFCKSAIYRYGPENFLDLLAKHHIAWHEKTLGQLFCDTTSQEIITMLLKECEDARVEVRTRCQVHTVEQTSPFRVLTCQGSFETGAVVIATGGLSIPALGATGFGYDIARKYGLAVTPLQPGLVPFTLGNGDQQRFSPLSGVSFEAEVTCESASFREKVLITHRGLSGPAILQISSYWQKGKEVKINLSPGISLDKRFRSESSTVHLKGFLDRFLPRRFAEAIEKELGYTGPVVSFTPEQRQRTIARLQEWKVAPIGTEGYRKAEVTVGGIDTEALSSQTLEAKAVPGLYFIGEVVDVTGWLGGYNFQWAWASGQAAGKAV